MHVTKFQFDAQLTYGALYGDTQFNETLVQPALQAISGGEGSRTPVQTYSAKAFYMLILVLIVGKQQEPGKPIISLAGWS